MKYFTLILMVLFFYSCSNKKEPIQGVTEFQKELNALFKDASKSPLKETDRKGFKSLDFFTVDSAFIVQAYLKRTPDSTFFKMATTLSRVKMQRVFGVLSFKIKNKLYRLNAYESQDLLNEAAYENYLFLPFLDLTNGTDTYGGGRYIDLHLTDKDKDTLVTIDFNTAYNPYCAYNEKYSCPIVPRVNFINLEIKAGVKAFNK